MKWQNLKIKNIKSIKGKAVCYTQGDSHRVLMHFPAETLQSRRERNDIFKVIKGESLQPRILYLARISFRFGQEIKNFKNKQKLKGFNTTKPVLQDTLKELL